MGVALHLNKLESSSPKDAFAKFGWFWRGICLSLFRNYHPVEKGVALHLNKLEFYLSKDALCQAIRKAHLSFQRR